MILIRTVLAETPARLQIGPYTVPEAHTVQASFGLLNQSASEGWVEPERFDPERFLDADTGKVSRSHKLIPFSTGKRQCPAETLATSQVSLAQFERAKGSNPTLKSFPGLPLLRRSDAKIQV